MDKQDKARSYYLQFGNFKVMVSSEELAQLEAAYLNFVSTEGTGFGFVYYLLGGGKDEV